MPYIDPLIRPIFDAIYNEATYVGTRQDISTTCVVEKLIKAIHNFPLEKQDGCLNYFITKILLHLSDKEIAKEIIRQIFLKEFLVEPSYFKLERALGLAVCILAELKYRDDWEPQYFAETLIRDKIDDIEVSRQIYEEAKIKENGDVK